LVADLQAARLDVRAAELDVRAARAERAPTVAVQGSVGAWTGRNQLLESDAPHVLGGAAGIVFDMPIWNAGAIAARVDRQVAALAGSQATYRMTARHWTTALQTAQASRAAALQRLARMQENRDRAADQYRTLRTQYAGGGSSGLEVLDAHRTLLDIAAQAQVAQAEAARSQIEILRLTREAP
jgi:outer membrane protein TolC